MIFHKLFKSDHIIIENNKILKTLPNNTLQGFPEKLINLIQQVNPQDLNEIFKI
jgi:hypothetical protein